MLVQQGVVDKQVDIDPLLEVRINTPINDLLSSDHIGYCTFCIRLIFVQKFAELDARQCGYIETEVSLIFRKEL